MGNGMGSGFLKLNTGCIQKYPTTLADTIGNGNTGKFELHAGGSYPYIIFGDYNTNDEAKKEKSELLAITNPHPRKHQTRITRISFCIHESLWIIAKSHIFSSKKVF